MITSTIIGEINPSISPSFRLSLVRKNVPVVFKLLLLFVMSEVKLYRYQANIIVSEGPHICIGAFVEVNKLTCKPVIFTAVRIVALKKILLIFSISLPADL